MDKIKRLGILVAIFCTLSILLNIWTNNHLFQKVGKTMALVNTRQHSMIIDRNFEITENKQGWMKYNFKKMETNFVKIPDRELIVWSAFYDNRTIGEVKFMYKEGSGSGLVQPWNVKRRPVIAMLGLSARRLASTYCHVYYSNASISEAERRRKRAVSKMRMLKFRPMNIWRNNLFICDVNLNLSMAGGSLTPVLVGLSASRTTIPSKFIKVQPFSGAKPKSTIGVCVSTIYGNLSKVNFAEFIEYYRYMGINKFYLYEALNITNELSKLLTWYEQKDVVEYIPWRLPYGDKHYPKSASQNSFDNHVHKAQNTDCVYRNHGRHKWMLHVDVDEFIVPKLDMTIDDMIKRVAQQENYPTKVSSLRFRHVQFCTDLPTTYNPKNSDIHEENDTEFDLLFNRYRISSKPWPLRPDGARSKFLSNPSGVEFVGSHRVPLALKDYKEINVDPNIATLHHYRKPVLDKELPCNQNNTHALKYVKELVRSVAFVLKSSKM